MNNRIFTKLQLREIRPDGFMRRVLELQARGLTGNIRFLWEDLSGKSAWLGGTGEAWERGPYYLDGLIPLVALLGDPVLENEARHWVDCIVASQDPSGFFGPAWNTDWWPRTVALKALVSWHGATGDSRIIPFMDRYFEYQYRTIDAQPLVFWAAARALEAAEAIELVYRETGKQYLTELAVKLRNGMFDWFGFFADLPYKKPTAAYLNKTIFNLIKMAVTPLDALAKKDIRIKRPKPAVKAKAFNENSIIRTISLTHGVNIAMALKYPASFGLLSGDTEPGGLPRRGYSQLMECHGTAIGLWTSDEHLGGPDPSNGTELCTVVEALYSLEEALSITGDPFYADIAELLAYNALPATFTPDMCAHQYVQQANQIAADRKRRQFFDTDREANTFGLEPNYGCCAANMHQGFPKFAANACHRAESGLAFLVYMPCTVSTKSASGNPLVISEETDYPFGSRISFRILAVDEPSLTLSFRVPALTKMELFYNGTSEGVFEAGMAALTRGFYPGDSVDIELDAPLTVVPQADGSIAFRKGSLLLALKIEEECRSFRGLEPFDDREFVPVSEWNLAPLLKHGKAAILETVRREIPLMPFDVKDPPLELRVTGVKIHNWKKRLNSAGPCPANPDFSEERTISLVPYGCTNLRIAQFPIAESPGSAG